MQNTTRRAKVSPMSSGYGSDISPGATALAGWTSARTVSTASAGGTSARSARSLKTRPNSTDNLNGSRRTPPMGGGNHAGKMRSKSEKIRRAEDTKKAMAKAVLPAKLATFPVIVALITALLVSAFKVS